MYKVGSISYFECTGKLQDRINFHGKIKNMDTNAKQFEITKE